MRGRWKGGKGGHGGSSNGGSNTKVSEICRHFVQQGNCKFGQNCNYSHILRQVAQIQKAHFGGIRCAISSPLPTGELELFTGGCDGQLKRWIIRPADKDVMNNEPERGGNNRRRNYQNKFQNDISGATQLSVKMDSAINCSAEVCSCLIYGDVLFCGLINGTIRAFHKPTGNFTDLIGHSQEIHQLLIIDNILVSACWGGKIVFWKFDQASGTFVISAQIQAKEHIKCLKYFPYKNNSAGIMGQQPQCQIQDACPHLWVCGGGIVQIVDLITLQVVREIIFDGGPIMSVLEYENHLVLCSLQGVIRVISPTGEETFRKSLGSPTLCMDGTITADAKHILMMGQNNGHLRCITLPLFDSVLEFHTPDTRSEIRLVSNLGGSPGIILTAQWDGALNFYQWCLPKSS